MGLDAFPRPAHIETLKNHLLSFGSPYALL